MLRDTASVFLTSLEAPCIKSVADLALKKKQRKKGSRWCIDDSISPYDLYTYLKARFGDPNGLTMLFRSPSTDNFIQWHYTLLSGDNLVEFFGFNTRMELWIEGYPDLADEDWQSLVKAIKADFATHAKDLKRIRSGYEQWKLFYNPHFRLESIVGQMEEDLRSLNLDDLDLPPQPHAFGGIVSTSADRSEDIKVFSDRMSECGKIYARAQVLSASLRMVTPVWAESFINLLIFVLARDELKKDKRLYEDFRRKEIDIRVKSMHLNCTGFDRQIDSEADEFKEFHRLMNQRNDTLHGNTDPDRLAFQDVYFDEMIPLFPKNLDFGTSVLRHSMVGIEPVTTLKNIATVRNFFEFVLGHLDKTIAPQMRHIMSTRDLGWRESTQRIGLLFSDQMGEGYIR